MREINRIIWHCSATREGQDVTTETIRSWHVTPKPNGRGWSDIGYHFVVELDGTVVEGRPIERPGAHVHGHNEDTIGICYVGGVMLDGMTPKDTRTPEQREALYSLTETLLRRFPSATVHGHNEYAAKACPSFNAQKDWAKHCAKGDGLSPDITPGLKPEDMRDEDFEPDVDPEDLKL